jgi:ESS family glutamate:Na+ symporter
MAHLFGIHPTFGVLAGAVSLAGGHGSALAFGSLLESNGIAGAEATGLAAATFGVLAASILGAPVGKYLIFRHNIKIVTTDNTFYSQYLSNEAKNESFDHTRFLRLFTLVLVCMALGSWIGEYFNVLLKSSSFTWLKNFSFPDYIWVMLLAVIIRNVGYEINFIKSCTESLGLILSLSLRYAVAFVVMSISIYELHDIALPLISILFFQTALVVLITISFLFPLLGKDYDAAVICSGLCGLMLGASHSAMSNISTVCEQHNKNYSQKAFFVVSLCGATLVDIFMLTFSSVCISMLF